MTTTVYFVVSDEVTGRVRGKGRRWSDSPLGISMPCPRARGTDVSHDRDRLSVTRAGRSGQAHACGTLPPRTTRTLLVSGGPGSTPRVGTRELFLDVRVRPGPLSPSVPRSTFVGRRGSSGDVGPGRHGTRGGVTSWWVAWWDPVSFVYLRYRISDRQISRDGQNRQVGDTHI